MKIALLGYGKMGRLVEQAAVHRGHEIVCRMNHAEDGWPDVSKADLCIDFSQGDAVLGHLEKCGKLGKNLVIGTTGWESRIEEAEKKTQQFGIGVLYASNFSIGGHLFLKILDYGAKIMNSFAEYDVAGIEFHHSKKKDAPSGTALEICRRMKKGMDRLDRFEMTAVRLGSIPGTHQVMFDSPVDTISIRHEARNREGFAKGAVQAAEWLVGKTGFYTLDDLIEGATGES